MEPLEIEITNSEDAQDAPQHQRGTCRSAFGAVFVAVALAAMMTCVSLVFLWPATPGDSVAVEAKVGHVLRDRYVLTGFVESREKFLTLPIAGGQPGISFPNIVRRGVSGPKHLGTGSFGDVWKAFDKLLNKEIAVKIFYTKDQSGRQQYANWGMARYDRRLREELETNIKECSLVKEIVSHSQMYPAGASKICQCFDEHISDVRQQPDRVVFLAQEMCGQSLFDAYLQPHQQRRTADLPLARSIIKQMLEGVAYLNMFKTPLIHHDLKPQNVVINNGEVKLIDWGGLVFANRQNQFTPCVMTPVYAPPEADGSTRQAYHLDHHGAHSYDVYAIGIMMMEFICPSLPLNTWYSYRPLNAYTVRNLVRQLCWSTVSQLDKELTLVGNMIHLDPRRRPKPMDALENKIFDDENLPNVVQQSTAQLKFAVGAEVEYYSDSLRKFIMVVVEGHTHDAHGVPCYKLITPGTPVMGYPCAPEWKLRGKETEVVDEAFKVPIHQVPDNEDAKDDGDLLQKNQIMVPMQDPEDAGKDAHVKYIEISATRQILTVSKDLKVQAELSCRHPAKCSDHDVIMLCGQSAPVHLTFRFTKQIGDRSVVMAIELKKGDSRLGQKCKLKAVAAVSVDGGASETQMSAPKIMYLYDIETMFKA